MLAIAQYNSGVGGAIMNGFAQNHETEKSEHHFDEEHPRVEGNTTPRPPARVAHCTLNLLLREGSSLGSICRSTLRQWSNELVRKGIHSRDERECEVRTLTIGLLVTLLERMIQVTT